jgi:putative transposase
MPAVGKPQAKFLETLFATILALRGRVNLRHLSRDCASGERTRARQCRRCVDWPDCHQRVITVALEPCSAVLSAQEASFLPTRGQQTCGLGPCCNGCTSRTERGVEISPLAVVEVTRRCAFTRAGAQTPAGDDATGSQQATEETRGDCYRQQRREPCHRLPPQVPSHGVDGDLAKKQYLHEAVRLDRPPMPKRRGDADGRFRDTGPPPKRRGARRQYDGTVDVHDLRRLEARGTMVEAAPLPLYTAVVWPVTCQRQLRLVVVVNRKAPAKRRSIVLACTDLALDGRQLAELSGARVQLELLGRDSQQFTGLSGCHARAEAARGCHFNAALATLNLARPEHRLEQTGESPQVFSMASWKPRHLNERWRDVFIEQ